jgi:hypothetical protein
VSVIAWSLSESLRLRLRQRHLHTRSDTPREDRILNEIHDSGGDVRRICDLFGLTVDAALRYTTVLEPAPRSASDSVD